MLPLEPAQQAFAGRRSSRSSPGSGHITGFRPTFPPMGGSGVDLRAPSNAQGDGSERTRASEKERAAHLEGVRRIRYSRPSRPAWQVSCSRHQACSVSNSPLETSAETGRSSACVIDSRYSRSGGRSQNRWSCAGRPSDQDSRVEITRSPWGVLSGRVAGVGGRIRRRGGHRRGGRGRRTPHGGTTSSSRRC